MSNAFGVNIREPELDLTTGCSLGDCGRKPFARSCRLAHSVRTSWHLFEAVGSMVKSIVGVVRLCRYDRTSPLGIPKKN